MILLFKSVKYIITLLLLILSFSLVSCNFLGNIKNEDNYFTSMKSKGIDEISMQNIRDKSFKFLVSDEKSIQNIYNLLVNAKQSNVRCDVEPDYIVQIVFGDEIKQFNYIVGDYEGNFYNDEVSFTISKRLDESIIQNLTIIRKPREFEYIYYNSIYEVLKKLGDEVNISNLKIGIDIKEDKDCLKYIFSKDITNFLEDSKKLAKDIQIIESNENNFDIIIRVKNRGYSTTKYKTNITVEDKINKTEKYYYIYGENEYKEWKINIYTKENLPKDIEKNW